MKKLFDYSLDKKLENIQTLNWIPWVGTEYINSENPKILIIGESHYAWEKEEDDIEPIKYLENKDFSRNFINQRGLHFLNKNGIEQTHLVRNTERAIFNTTLVSNNNKLKLWNNSCYYVFIQRHLDSRDSQSRPTEQDYEIGWDCFFNVIEILKPDICLFLGLESSNMLNAFQKNAKDNHYISANISKDVSKINRSFPRYGEIINKNQKKTKLIFIKHPSSFFSWDKWSPFLEEKIPEYFNWIRENK